MSDRALGFGRPQLQLFDDCLGAVRRRLAAASRSREKRASRSATRETFSRSAAPARDLRRPVGGEVGDALRSGSAPARQSRRHACRFVPLPGDRLKAEDRPDQFGLAAADQAGDAGDFSGAGHRRSTSFNKPSASVSARPASSFSPGMCAIAREQHPDLAAGHQLDQFALRRRRGVASYDLAAVAQDGDRGRQAA